MKRVTLQRRLLLYSTLLIVLLMSLVIFLVEKRLSKSIRSQVEKRGQALTKNLAAVSANALVIYDYVGLEQMAERARQEEDIAYIIISDKENRVAVFTGHDEKQGEVLTDPFSQAALQTDRPLVQKSHWETRLVLDFAVPVFIVGSSEKWGTVRIGLSLEEMYSHIQQTRIGLAGLGLLALCLGFMGAVIYARRITGPLRDLVQGTVLVSQGDLNQKIEVETGDENEELAKNFIHMVCQAKAHRKELEEQLHEISELKRYQGNILQSMTNGLIAIDMKGRITTVNQSTLHILGMTQKDLVGTHVHLLPQPWTPLGRLLWKSLERSRVTRNRDMKIRKNGRDLWIMITTALLVDESKRKLGALCVFQDMTDLKELREKMKEADRLAALGRLSASLAHEIRNPLSAIKTFVQLIPRKFESPIFRDKLNTTVPRELERINRLVDNLLQLTRKPKLNLSLVDLNEVLAQTTELYQGEMDTRNVEFHAALRENMPRVRADAELLHRAFSNILVNAIQAMPQGGTLTVSSGWGSAADRNEKLEVTVRDSGIGMDRETLKKLFDPFFITKKKGTGLGLVNAKRIIEEHGGGIDVSSAPGKGTVVIVTLPLA